jgi:PKD repeat protein/fibronectin type 3 domain-containing protein
MRHLSHLLCNATALFVAICFQQKALAQTNLTTEVAQAAGSNWGQAIWVTNAPGTYVAGTAVVPVAGNTYELVPNGAALAFSNAPANTRVRNPTAMGSSQTFPGDSLTIDTNCEIRFKDITGINNGGNLAVVAPANFPGVNNNPGLILDGGLLDDGDNGIWDIEGRIAVVGQGPDVSVLAPGGNMGNPPVLTEAMRGLIIGGQLSGSGEMALVLTPTNIPVMITNGLNTFNGNWIIQEGWLIGTTPQCLGSANITVDPLNTNCIIQDYPGLILESRESDPTADPSGNIPAAEAILDFDYGAVCTGTLILTNGGLMNLHTNVIFGSLEIEGTILTNGVYTYSYLTNNFTNFLAGGSGQITIATPVAPPAPTNLATVAGTNSVQVSWFPAATATSYIISRSTNNGGPYTNVGTSGSLIYLDSGLTQFQTYYYVVQATNAFGVSPDSIQTQGTPSPPVTGVMATVNPTSVALSWSIYTNAFNHATSYTVQRSTVIDGTYTILTNGTTNLNYTDSSVANGTVYYYEVVAALSTGGTSASSDPVSVLTYPSLPAMTTDLYGTSGILLQLSTPDPQTPTYIVNASTDGINFSPLATLSGGINNFLDTGLNEGTEYYFDVQATNSSGMSAVSAVVSNAIPVGTISFAFGTGVANGGNPASPPPPGYIQDVGLSYFNNGAYYYGWVTNTVSVNSGWDMSAVGQGTYNVNNPPGDLRQDSFIHQTQDSEATNFIGLPASSYPFWAVSNIANGVYQVRVVSGDATANNSVYQQTVNGVTTPAVTPSTGSPFAQWVVVCQVTNNTMTVAPASTNNDKINYIDIYPAVLPAASFTYGPASGLAPLTVNFTNTSTGSYTADIWTFDTNGDTLASTNQVVSFTYTNAGTFTVSLTVSNDFGNFSTYTLTNAVTAPSQPVISSTIVSNGKLIFSGTNGVADGTYYVLTSTNLVTPLTNWTVLSTNTFGATGAFNVTNAINPGTPRRFYIIGVP